MSNRAELLKSIVKGDSDISEDASLDKYLLSRGINPKHVTKDQKVAHSKMGQFIKWKRDHMMEDTLDEVVDKKDTVTLDIPLLIRVLELAREDIKTDMDLHRVVEKLINIRKKGMLTMKDYNYIAKIHEEVFGENHIAIAMGKMLDDEGSMILNQLDDIDRCSKMIRDYVGKNYEKQMPAWVQSKVTLAADYINTVGTYLMSKNEEVEHINEWGTDIKQHSSKVFHVTNKRTGNHIGTIVTPKITNPKYRATVHRGHGIGGDLHTKEFDSAKEARAHIEKSHGITEEVTQIDEISTDGYYKAAIKSRQTAAVKVASSMGQDKQAKTKLNARNAGMKRVEKRTQDEIKKANSGPQKPRPTEKTPTEAERRGYGQGRYMGDSVEYNDTPMVEAQSAAIRFHKALQDAKKKREQEEARKEANEKRALQPKPVTESRTSEMSKSARMIKSIYKKKGMKEDMYDHEKEDKSVATYGKKPKMSVTSKESSFGEKKPDASAVLTGGTTLTGQPRDTVEIDPMMRKRPGPNIPGKKN